MKKFLKLLTRNKKKTILYFILFFLVVMSVDIYICEENKPTEVSYAEFMKDLNRGKIDTIYYTASEETMRYTLYNDETKKMSKEEKEKYKYPKDCWRMTTYPAQEDFRKEMLEKGVSLQVKSFEPKSVVVLSTLASLVIPFFLFFLAIRLLYGNMNKVKSEDLLQTSDVTFSDVIGHDEVIEDLKFIVELLKDPVKGSDLGAEIPRGILLSGDPGTGKTLLAKAIAGESHVPFIYMNASNFIEVYVGTGAKRVRELFNLAKKSAPCIIFIDEIDAIGQERGSNRGNSENDQTINALLQEMDGFKDRGNIFVIAATNNPDNLDKALIRAGRFDRQIIVRPPKDWTVRKKLFDFYLDNCLISDDVNTEILSKQLVGFTGADISAVVNEAKIIATMKDLDYISMENLEEAIDKIIFKGNRSKTEVFRKDKEIVAYHEAGHAVVTYLLGEPIARATIISTTSGIGGAVFGAEGSTSLLSKDYYENKVKICYGGRVSESIKFKSVTSGASNDIEQATTILSEYVTKLGFDDDFGVLNLDVLLNKHLIDSSNSFEVIQSKAKNLYNDTYNLLVDNYELVELLALKLLEMETLSGDAIIELLGKEGV